MKPAFSITPQLPPAPQWFHILFGNRWGAYITWGNYPIQGEGSAAEVDVTFNSKPTGEIHGHQSPEQVVSILSSLVRRKIS